MVTRTWFAQPLAIFLCLILAWPTPVPFPEIGPAALVRVEGLSKATTHGAIFHSRERKPLLDQGSWSDLADNFEGSDGRDDFVYWPPAIGQFPIDLPSLIPSTMCFLPAQSVEPSHPFVLALHLRC